MAATKTSRSGGGSGGDDYMFRASKRLKTETSGGLARFKGIVPQQNGHWGAQIYANHQRIWLGTFKSENEAALAYDSAAIGLRIGDTHRNFPWSYDNIQEPNFQNLHTTRDILNMIKSGSYQSIYADYTKSSANHNKNTIHNDTKFACQQLFQKELTPSDVGKLNRLVIPKKHAVKHFPHIENDHQTFTTANGGCEDVELVFYDTSMKMWRFRYCYCKSSQSFVFTRGWNRFVKDKKLKEKDAIAFYTCECTGEIEHGRGFFLIDVNYNGGDDENGGRIDVFKRLGSSSLLHHHQGELHVGLELNLGTNFYCNLDEKHNENGEEQGLSGLKSSSSYSVKEKRITLFGARIN
ncbi:hypothetical protein Goshw_016568 [Gossypium schwendimanii]|uniref:AP2/ERF and B3 domain-containing transcription factor n=1 Tax=Gossypium schwendimanii TaxID=34291 RepID=A0A7J9L489_GOSSC|nr:hypothetical protein [Gossypium schwendimanii]